MAIRELETTRLLLRLLQLLDAAATQRLFPHWKIVRYLANQVSWPYPADGAITYYRDFALPAMELGDEWHWSLRLKDGPDDLIGAVCLVRNENNNRGFWVGAPWQRKGLMSEATVALNDFWFDELGFARLRVRKAIANGGSRRISEKTGMRVIAREERDYVSGWLESEIWELTAGEWRSRPRIA